MKYWVWEIVEILKQGGHGKPHGEGDFLEGRT